MKNSKGSALLVAIILSAVLLLMLAGLLGTALNEYRASHKSYLNSAAFGLAESGIDISAAEIMGGKFASAIDYPANAALASGQWYKKTSTGKYYYTQSVSMGNGRTGTFSVICVPDAGNANIYTVYSLGQVAGAAGVGDRAIQVTFAKKAGNGSGSGYAMAARRGISLGSGGANPFTDKGAGFIRVGSYDSQLNDGKAEWYTEMSSNDKTLKQGESTGSNYGDKATVVVESGELKLTNSIIYGEVASTAAGSVNPDKATVVDLAVAQAYKDAYTKYNYGYDPVNKKEIAGDNVDTNFKLEDTTFSDPAAVLDKSGNFVKTDFDLTSYTQITMDNQTGAKVVKADGVSPRDDLQNQSVLDLGVANTKTYLLTDAVSLNKVVVHGEVVIYARGRVNMTNGINIELADPSAKLTIIPEAGGDIKLKSYKSTYTTVDASGKKVTPPSQPAPALFNILTASTADFTLNFDGNSHTFTSIIKAPNAIVRMSGNGQRNDAAGAQMQARNQFCGQIIAKTIDLSGSNNIDILYDVRGSGGSGVASALSLANWKQITPATFAAAQ